MTSEYQESNDHPLSPLAETLVMCFAEAVHFQPAPIHFVAKPKDFPQEATGPRIFASLNVDQHAAVPLAEIKALSEELKKALSTTPP